MPFPVSMLYKSDLEKQHQWPEAEPVRTDRVSECTTKELISEVGLSLFLLGYFS